MKLFLKILAALVGVVIVAVVALVFLVDANTFKPRIEALARDQGIPLTIEGDLSWQFLPALGIEVEGVSVADPANMNQPLAQVGRASLRLAIRPLLRGEVEVHHLVVDSAHINLVVDETGAGNWEALIEQEAEPAPAEPETADTPLEEEARSELRLAVERISLRDSSLNYTAHSADTDPLRLTLRDLQLEIEGFNLQGEAFPLALEWRVQLGDDTQEVGGQLKAQLQFAADFSELALRGGQLVLQAGPETTAEVNFEVRATDLLESPGYEGRLAVEPVNARQWLPALGQEVPETAAADALTRVGFEGRFTGGTERLVLEPFTLTLDETRLQGRLALSDFTTGAVELAAQGGRLNLDNYLPPAQEEVEEASDPAEDTPLPLEPLRELIASLSLDLDELVVAEMPLQQLRVRLNADKGLIQLQEISARIYEGDAQVQGQLDARGDNAILQVDTGVKGLQLAPLMRDRELDENLDLRGAINLAAQVTTRGVSVNQLIEAADAEADFSGDQVRLAPLNVEQKFCEIVGLVTGESTADGWAPYTEMKQLSGRAQLRDQVVSLEGVTAGVERLKAALQGKVDLAQGNYDLTLPLTLPTERTSETGCRVKSNFWLDRPISLLRCRGSLEALDPVGDCRPDSRGLAALTRDFARYQLEKQHGDKIDAAEQKLEERKDELRRRVEEELGGEKARDVEDRLKNLFRR